MDRRTFCATTAGAITATLVGCVGTTTDAEPESETPTPSTPPARPHDLYVMNYTTTTETATVRVVDGDGTAIVDGRYELPNERGIEFVSVGAWEQTYTVELTIAGNALQPVTWETPSCAGNEKASQGSRDGYVRLQADETDGFRATVAVDDCDAILGPEYPTGPAKGFRVEE